MTTPKQAAAKSKAQLGTPPKKSTPKTTERTLNGQKVVIPGTTGQTYVFRGKLFTLHQGKWYDQQGKAMGAEGTAALKKAQGSNGLIASDKNRKDLNVYSFGGVGDLDYGSSNWLSKGADSTYTTNVSANNKALQDYEDDNATLRQRHLDNFGLAQHNMGYYDGAWQGNDQTTSYGQDLNNQGYDFGARGATHSSDYANARQNLQTSYQKQLDAQNTGSQQFLNDVSHANTLKEQDTTANNTAELKDALARYAASKQKVV